MTFCPLCPFSPGTATGIFIPPEQIFPLFPVCKEAGFLSTRQIFTMKKTIALTMLLFACLQMFGQVEIMGAGISISYDTSIVEPPIFTTEFVNSDNLQFSTNGDQVTIRILGAHDCIPFTRHTKWAAFPKGIEECDHSWVYAAEDDVNVKQEFQTMQFCQCGCTVTTNEARICSKCYRHETRTRFDGWDLVVKEDSEYMKILKIANSRN